MSFKVNPKIYGFTDKHIYLCNYNKMTIMCRQTGKIVKSMNLLGNRPYFMLDAQENIIQVNTLGKKITLFNSNLDFLVESLYSDDLDIVLVTKENKLAFVDVQKLYIIFI